MASRLPVLFIFFRLKGLGKPVVIDFPPQLFITGTDTGVGKSYVAALLAVGLAATYWKPVQSGAETDSVWLRKATGLPRSSSGLSTIEILCTGPSMTR